MVTSAQAAFNEVDILLLIIDMSRPDDPGIPLILKGLRGTKKPSLLLINKIDQGSKEMLLPIMDAYRQRHPFDALIPISALKGDGMEWLLEELRSRLRPGPVFFPRDMKTGSVRTISCIRDHSGEDLSPHQAGGALFLCCHCGKNGRDPGEKSSYRHGSDSRGVRFPKGHPNWPQGEND